MAEERMPFYKRYFSFQNKYLDITRLGQKDTL